MQRLNQTLGGENVIVGGGIIGLSLAYQLAMLGQSVIVLDRERAGRAASWAGVGILPPAASVAVEDPLEQLRALSHRLHAEWAARLRAETGLDNGWRACGGLYVATSRGEAATLAANELWWRELGIRADRWSTEDLLRHEPRLTQLAHAAHLQAVWWLPDECQLRPPHHTRALHRACTQRGVQIVEHCPVQSIEPLHSGRVRLLTAQGELEAQRVCITAGPWTRGLLEPLHLTSGILPIRGQVILFHPAERWLQSVINEGHRYLVPRDDGRILVGSNEEEVGFDCQDNQQAIEELRAWACSILPELSAVPIEKTWAGLRPASFDGYPYIGRLPNYPQVFVAAGHFRAGIHLSCGSASVLAELMLHGQASIDLNCFRPGRG